MSCERCIALAASNEHRGRLDGRDELPEKPHIGKLSSRMVEALDALAQGNTLDYTDTCVGRPTKQRLAKFGLVSICRRPTRCSASGRPDGDH